MMISIGIFCIGSMLSKICRVANVGSISRVGFKIPGTKYLPIGRFMCFDANKGTTQELVKI